jgi:hypothetical protein
VERLERRERLEDLHGRRDVDGARLDLARRLEDLRVSRCSAFHAPILVSTSWILPRLASKHSVGLRSTTTDARGDAAASFVVATRRSRTSAWVASVVAPTSIAPNVWSWCAPKKKRPTRDVPVSLSL